MRRPTVRRVLMFTVLGLVLALLLAALGSIALARALVLAEAPFRSEAVVVLFHDTEIYRRMIEAARLYREGMADKVVLNGGRKIDVLIQMEKEGFTRDWRWSDEYLPFLEYLGVPRSDVVCIDVEDAFDTPGEARKLGSRLIELGYRDIMVTTNKFHSRRAGLVWKSMYRGRLNVRMVPVRDEAFTVSGWWKDGRQFKWTVYEVGAWMFMAFRGMGVEG